MSVSHDAQPATPTPKALLWITSVVAFGVLLAGAVRTSAQIWAGIGPEHQSLSQSVVLAKGHEHAGNLLAVLLIVCTIMAWRSGNRMVMLLAGTATVASVCEVLMGLAGSMQLATVRTYMHAVCGHVIFACIASSAVISAWRTDPERVISIRKGFPVREFADWIPVLVISQVAMGAAYRHNFWSVMPHMAGAILVAFLFVAEGVTLLQRAPEHRVLRSTARHAIGIVIAQIALGIADFVLRLLDFQASTAWFAVSIAHVAMGSITLATSVCLAVAVRAFVKG